MPKTTLEQLEKRVKKAELSLKCQEENRHDWGDILVTWYDASDGALVIKKICKRCGKGRSVAIKMTKFDRSRFYKEFCRPAFYLETD